MRHLVIVALISCGGCGDERSPSPIQPTPPAQPLPPQPTPPADSLPNLAGDYTITFMAKCDGWSSWPMLPPEFWSRTYPSRLEQNGRDVKVVMTGLPRIFAPGDPGLWGQIRSDGVVTLTNYYGNDQYDQVDEQVTPANFVRIVVDEMELSASPKGLSGTFSGSFSLHDRNGTGWNYIIGHCSSTSHSVTLSR